MRAIDTLIIHCSATDPAVEVTVDTLREWHLKRGWDDIGYHYVIYRDGTIEEGRPEEIQGAHTYGHNQNSLGICLIGGNKSADFTFRQYVSLFVLVKLLKEQYSIKTIQGHHYYDKDKDCPCFDVPEFFSEIHQNE